MTKSRVSAKPARTTRTSRSATPRAKALPDIQPQTAALERHLNDHGKTLRSAIDQVLRAHKVPGRLAELHFEPTPPEPDDAGPVAMVCHTLPNGKVVCK